MSELMPEKRLDSNGKLVTRWVKPADATAGNRTPLPPVKMNPSKHASISKRLKQAASDKYITIPESINMDAIGTRIDALPNDSADSISGILDSMPDDEFLDAILISAFDQNYSRPAVEDIVYFYANMDDEQRMNLTGYTGWSDRGFDGAIIIKDSLSGCSAMKLDGLDYEYGVSPLRDHGDETLSKVAAYYTVVDCMESEFTEQSELTYGENKEACFEDRELASFIVDNHENVESILELMRSLRTSSVGRIKEAMETESKSLWSGVL
jgi:hypothetical protein